MAEAMPLSARAVRVLVVDDDAGVREVVRRYLEAQQFHVGEAGDAVAARLLLEREPYDLVLLDLGLPGEDGLDLARRLRERWPVIIVSGRADPVDRVIGLEVGADDYVTKPFDLRELLARIRSVLRRSGGSQARDASAREWLEIGGLRLDVEARRLEDAEGEEIALTSGEFDLLRVLAEQPNRVLSRDTLMQRLHGRDAGPFDRAIDVQVRRLRQKIERDPAQPAVIKAIRGVGYMLACPVRRKGNP
jgi:two-component system OmpR family response regulator